ncbi:MAG: NAD-dependent epimerase/dehydratase family protein [Saprospiraceae bacterium]|nr:NAD-dependent epimerase/dehydratase family protein [Saprospiraceae bacterium]
MTFDSSKKILVTGGTGFLGTYLLHLLVLKGYNNIYVLKGKNSDTSLLTDIIDKINFVEGDLLDIGSLENALSGVKQVYHCAAKVSFDARDAQIVKKVNINGTANLVNQCIEEKIEKLVYISSVAALGRVKHQTMINENTAWQYDSSSSVYSYAKFFAEQEVWRGMAEGLDVAVLNPSIIIGSGLWDKGTCTFFPTIYKGLKFYPSGSTGFVDVRDVARMAVQLMEGSISNERFLCNGVNIKYKDFFDKLALNLHIKSPTIKVGRRAAIVFARLDSIRTRILGKYPLITVETAKASTSEYNYDNAKSKNVLAFEYTPFSKTIEETCSQYLQSLKLKERFAILPLT